MTQSVISFEELRNKDVAIVGGKNASLGEMISQLKAKGVRVPTGFATTADAFNDFLIQDQLGERIEQELIGLDINDVVKLAQSGKKIRKWILDTPFSSDFENNIKHHYDNLIYIEVDSHSPKDLFSKSNLLKNLKKELGSHSTVPMVFHKGKFVGGNDDSKTYFSNL